MKGLWLGQAGYVFTSAKGTKVMIDPYLSNSLEKQKGSRFKREVAIDPDYLRTPVDVLVLTHIHGDHTDLDTLDVLLDREPISVLAPADVCETLLQRYGSGHNYTFALPGTELSYGDVLLHTTYAAHSVPQAIGVIIEADGLRIYHSGDTLFNTRLITEIPAKPDVLIMPINGVGNNMNPKDAYRLYKKLEPRYVLPMHWDMFKFYGCDVTAFTDLLSREELTSVLIPEHYKSFDII